MKERDEIANLFSEAFAGAKVPPPPEVKENVDKALFGAPPATGTSTTRLWVVSIAALVIAGGASLWLLSGNNDAKEIKRNSAAQSSGQVLMASEDNKSEANAHSHIAPVRQESNNVATNNSVSVVDGSVQTPLNSESSLKGEAGSASSMNRVTPETSTLTANRSGSRSTGETVVGTSGTDARNAGSTATERSFAPSKIGGNAVSSETTTPSGEHTASNGAGRNINGYYDPERLKSNRQLPKGRGSTTLTASNRSRLERKSGSTTLTDRSLNRSTVPSAGSSGNGGRVVSSGAADGSTSTASTSSNGGEAANSEGDDSTPVRIGANGGKIVVADENSPHYSGTEIKGLYTKFGETRMPDFLKNKGDISPLFTRPAQPLDQLIDEPQQAGFSIIQPSKRPAFDVAVYLGTTKGINPNISQEGPVHQSVSEKFGFSTSLEVGVTARNGFGVVTGVGYSQRQETFTQRTTIPDSILVCICEQLTPNPQDTTIMDTSTVLIYQLVDNYVDELSVIQQTTISVPLYLRWNRVFANQFYARVSAGARFEFYKFKWISSQNPTAMFTQQQFGVSVLVRPEFGYQFGQLGLGVYSTMNYQLSHGMRWNGLNRNRYGLGLGVNLSYSF